MTKLDISISSIKYTVEVSDEELDSFKQLAKTLNQKTNELMMKTGKISDRLLLFIIILININKKEKIFNNFEDKITKLLKTSAQFLNNDDNLDANLIPASILSENTTKNIKDDKTSTLQDENILKILNENNKTNEETLKILEEITNFVEKLANNINKM